MEAGKNVLVLIWIVGVLAAWLTIFAGSYQMRRVVLWEEDERAENGSGGPSHRIFFVQLFWVLTIFLGVVVALAIADVLFRTLLGVSAGGWWGFVFIAAIMIPIIAGVSFANLWHQEDRRRYPRKPQPLPPREIASPTANVPG